jgi:hypothetical protein
MCKKSEIIEKTELFIIFVTIMLKKKRNIIFLQKKK